MFIPEREIPEYQIHVDHALQQHGEPPAASMAISKPTPEFTTYLSLQAMKQGHPSPLIPLTPEQEHQDRIGSIGDVSETYWGLIHKPVSIPKAIRIPRAKEALDKEWDKIAKQTSMDHGDSRGQARSRTKVPTARN